MPTTAFVLIRAIHFASCLLILGTWAFDRFIMSPAAGPVENIALAQWRRIIRGLTWILLPAALVSGALWLACVAANMSGLSLNQAVEPQVLNMVWNQTIFGAVWKWRLAFCSATALLTGLVSFRQWSARAQGALSWFALAASGALAASLAWAGHGLAGSFGHRVADVAHLLAAGCWPAGLLPFCWILWALRRMPPAEGRHLRWELIRRFSMMSLIVVVVLSATGLVNTWCLVGSISALSSTDYGRWLVAKVFLFLVMVSLGALNVMRWKPRLSPTTAEQGGHVESAERWIHVNVAVEFVVAGIIILIIAVLGLLPPPFG